MFSGLSRAFGPKKPEVAAEGPRIRVARKDNVTVSILGQRAGGPSLHIRLGRELVVDLGWELNQLMELGMDMHPKAGRWVLLYGADPDESPSKTHLTPYGGVGFRAIFALSKLPAYAWPQELPAQPVNSFKAGRLLCIELPEECRHISEVGGPPQPSLLTTAG